MTSERWLGSSSKRACDFTRQNVMYALPTSSASAGSIVGSSVGVASATGGAVWLGATVTVATAGGAVAVTGTLVGASVGVPACTTAAAATGSTAGVATAS